MRLRPGCVSRIGTLLLASALSLWHPAGRAAEKTGIVPPAPGEFLDNIPYREFIDFMEPPPPGPVFDIRNYHAVGDGKTVNTAAIRAAVLAARARGGGTVLVAGGDFVTGTIRLESRITLHVAADAVLRASRNRADYDPPSLIWCEQAEHVVIEGPGKILGEGENWWNPPRKTPPRTPPDTFVLKEAMAMHFDAKRTRLPDRPSPFLRLIGSTDLKVRNLRIENSPGWTLMIDRCRRVEVQGVVIHNNYHGGNTDGIDVCASSHVDINRCFVATGDDGIVLKNGYSKDRNQAMSDIRVTDCTVMSSTNCFKIGTETANDIRDVRVSDCRFFVEGIWPGGLSGIAIESVDGARVSRVDVENITMSNIMAPIFIRLGSRNRGKSADERGRLQEVRIRGVKATGVEFPCTLSGIPGAPLENIRLSDIDIRYRDAGELLEIRNPVPEQEKEYPEFAMFGDLPAYALWARHVNGLQVRNFKAVPRTGNRRAKFVWNDVFSLKLFKTDPTGPDHR